ncbi:MAG: hypothetical protein OZ948_04630 [Deltaproteobacteria bacterium]|nr:hypothetical protein [Deltaproteobacteria bacterium]
MGPTTKPDRPRLEPAVVAERSTRDRLELDLVVPEDLAVWPGHFPGNPILPGALQVAWVMEAVSRWRGAHALCSIPLLKFRRPILPGQRLTIRLRSCRQPGRLDFELADGARILSVGRLDLERASR